MSGNHSSGLTQVELDPQTVAFYRRTLELLTEAGVPFLLGGAYALAPHAGIVRHTKDLDVFVRRRDSERALGVLSEAGYRTELTFPHWLGKAYSGEDFIDVIFSSGNAIAEVDDAWFARAKDGEAWGVPVKLCPPEEIIWSKSFILERERYDGADIAHLIRACGERLDWQHLLSRYAGDRWRVLFSHLVLFGFIYPGERGKIPPWLMLELTRRLKVETNSAPADEKVCQGTVVSREQYLIDVNQWGYQDARLQPLGKMSEEEIAIWTDDIKPAH
jgi:hypothetical protein